MKSFAQVSALCLTAGMFSLTLAVPVGEVSAQERSLHERLLEEHRERRAGIIDGIGRAFSNFFDGDSSYRPEGRGYDNRYNPDRIYESSRPGPRSVPPGWDAPFPPPADLFTPRDRYDLYRREQQSRTEGLRQWRPEPPRPTEPVATNQPTTRAPIEDERTRPSYDRPEFFENLPGEPAPVRRVEPAVQPASVPERSVTIPEGSRESRRIGSGVLLNDTFSEATPDQIAPVSVPEESMETVGSPSSTVRIPESEPMPSTEPAVIGSQSTMPEGTQSIPLDAEFSTSSGGAISLRDLLEGNQAVMIDFWATWSGESMNSLTHLNTLAAEMQAFGIAVVGMNFDGNADTVERVRRGQDLTIPWLMEPRERPFSRDMGISALPHRLLIDSEGVVRFSGDPEDDSLRQVIDQIVNSGLGRAGE